MKQVLIKKGLAFTSQVPSSLPGEGEVLVSVRASCLSIGTELSGLRNSGIPLWKKAFLNPHKVMSAIKLVGNVGLRRVKGTIDEISLGEHATGYSASGVIVAVGRKIKGLSIGDRVACAGALYAHHAEFICVPENLCVRIPDDVNFEDASSVTLGAIALQGVRRAQPTLGEFFLVIGLGFIGQITAQILQANGCVVIGVDTDRRRLEKALSQGMRYGMHTDEYKPELIKKITNGFGVDGVIITAATSSDSVVSSAFRSCRKKGRVILVGDVGLNLNREDFYSKEIDFLVSTSYGPGRYDANYEEHGLDYPIGYVRWTENRNMAEYLNLISNRKVLVESLIAERYSIEDSTLAYAAISGSEKPLAVIFTYASRAPESALIPNRQNLINFSRHTADKIRIALIGAGSFARSSHLPNLKMLSGNYHLRAVVCKTGISAKNIGRQYDADYITTDVKDVLSDPDIDAVLIATPHHLHGSLTLEALRCGKHVLVEKPLTLSRKELAELSNFYNPNSALGGSGLQPILLTGYNRRFSSYFHKMKQILENQSSPYILNYRMNAGYISPDNWVHGDEGGGRNLGEACHIYDLFTALSNSNVIEVSAHAIKPRTDYYNRNDNFVATFSFSNGSIANLVYTALGNNDLSKESAELYVGGNIAVLDDYKSLVVHGDLKQSYKTRIQDKGLVEELKQFSHGIKTGEWPIPLWQQLQVSEMAFAVEEMIFR